MTTAQATPSLIPGVLLTDKNLAAIFKISRGQVWQMVKQGEIPPPIKLSARTTRWTSDSMIKKIAEISGISEV